MIYHMFDTKTTIYSPRHQTSNRVTVKYIFLKRILMVLVDWYTVLVSVQYSAGNLWTGLAWCINIVCRPVTEHDVWDVHSCDRWMSSVIFLYTPRYISATFWCNNNTRYISATPVKQKNYNKMIYTFIHFYTIVEAWRCFKGLRAISGIAVEHE